MTLPYSSYLHPCQPQQYVTQEESSSCVWEGLSVRLYQGIPGNGCRWFCVVWLSPEFQTEIPFFWNQSDVGDRLKVPVQSPKWVRPGLPFCVSGFSVTRAFQSVAVTGPSSPGRSLSWWHCWTISVRKPQRLLLHNLVIDGFKVEVPNGRK